MDGDLATRGLEATQLLGRESGSLDVEPKTRPPQLPPRRREADDPIEENIRVGNVYIDDPSTVTPAIPPRSTKPLLKGKAKAPITNQPTMANLGLHSSKFYQPPTSNRNFQGNPGILCNQCNKCMCSICVSRTDETFPAAAAAIDCCTCACCVRKVFAHFSELYNERSEHNIDPFSCCGEGETQCCERWTCICLTSLCLPCLCCYLPATGCLSLLTYVYNWNRQRHLDGCACQEEEPSEFPTKGKMIDR